MLFGIATLALTGVVAFWNDLGKPWGPGTSATLVYALFGLHVLLVFRRVSALDPLVWTPFALLLFYFGEPVVIEWMGLPVAAGYDPWQGGNDLLRRPWLRRLPALRRRHSSGVSIWPGSARSAATPDATR